MSRYTITIRQYLLSHMKDDEGRANGYLTKDNDIYGDFWSMNEVIDKTYETVFQQMQLIVPIDDYFKKAFCRRFYNCEIGFEVWAQFLTRLEDTLNTTCYNLFKFRSSLMTMSEEDAKSVAKTMVEKGSAADVPLAYAEIVDVNMGEETVGWRTYPLKFNKSKDGRSKPEFSCAGMTVVDAYKEYMEKNEGTDECVECEYEGHIVRLQFVYKAVTLETGEGPLDHVFFMENDTKIYPSTLIREWVMHVIGHAAGLNFATVIFCQKNTAAQTFRPLERERAIEILADFLKKAFSPLPKDYPDFNKTRGDDDMAMVESDKTVNTNRR